MKTDYLIVGSGLSALVFAALMAKSGKKVQVLKHMSIQEDLDTPLQWLKNINLMPSFITFGTVVKDNPLIKFLRN